MPAPQVLVPSKTDAETSQSFFVAQNHSVCIHCTPDLDGIEKAQVEISSSQDGTFVPYQDGALVNLYSSQNALRLYGPAFYKVAKEATASATAISLLR